MQLPYIVVRLVENAALLLALGVLYDMLGPRFRRAGLTLQQVGVGLVLGGIGVAVMSASVPLAPGVVFDTRSVLLSVAGLFFGGIPAFLAAVVTSAYRLFQGGAGAWTGVGVIVSSAAIGVAWRRWRRKDRPVSVAELYLMGLVVHAVMLLLMFSLPWPLPLHVLPKITFPVLGIYPLATAALGWLMVNREVRWRSQEALRRERNLLARIAEASPVGIMVVDRHGAITFANQGAEAVLGLSRKQIIERTYNHPDWRITDYDGNPFPEDELPFRRVMETGQPVRDVRHAIEWSDGRRVLLRINASPLFDENGHIDGMVAVVEDVTEKVRAEQALKRARDFAEDLIETANVIFVQLNTSGEIVRINRTAEEITGYSRSELVGKSWFETLVPRDRYPHVWEEFQRLLRPGEVPGEFENPILTRNGEERYIVWRNSVLRDGDKIVGTISFGMDITDRRRTEEALRRNEARLQSIFRAAPIGIGVVSERVIVDANERLCEMTGYSRDELVGQSSRILYPTQEEFERVGREKYAQIRMKGIGTVETCWRRKDGRVIDVLLSSAALYPENPSAATTFTALDITERKRAEEALRESEIRFRSIVEQSADGIAVTDEEGRLIVWNRSLERMTGIRAREATGRMIWDVQFKLLPPEQQTSQRYEELRSSLKTFLQTGKASWAGRTLEQRYRHPNGESRILQGVVFPVRTGRGFMLVSMTRDVTELRRFQTELERALERLRILHEIDRGILAAESPEQIAYAALSRIRHLVPCQWATVTVFDWEKAEAVVLASQLDRDNGVAEERRLPIQAYGLNETLKQGQIRVIRDLREWSDRAELHEVLLSQGLRSIVEIPLAVQGQMIGILTLASEQTGAYSNEHVETARGVADQLAVAILHAEMREQLRRYAAELEQRVQERTRELQDRVEEIETLNRALASAMEDLERTNESLRRTAEELRRANEELEAFAYSVSHDLRAPLRAMAGFAQALLEDYSDHLDELGRDYARRILEAARRMDELIRDLLEYSRLSRMKLELRAVDLEEVVKNVLDQLDAGIRERGAQVDVERPLPKVKGHPVVLQQMLSNLVANAVKFVRAGEKPRVRIRAEIRGHRVRIWVEDNGIGIQPDHQERIFRIFERLHGSETFPGTGIGLAIVKRGAERMGGRVGVESEVGRGSRFWVELSAGEGA